MNAERLLQLYERVSEAPDAISRLRRFVLDLAVRGKLVEQDPEDEVAPLLLKAIYREKKQLIADGVIRNPRSLADEHGATGPFQLPPTWLWTRLDTVGAIIGGGTPPAGDSTNFIEPGGGIPWLTPADLGGYEKEYISRGSRDLTEKGLASSSATLMPTGAVLFTSRAPIGYVAIASSPLATNQGFKSIVPYVGECSRYIAVAMRAFAPEIDASAPGTTFKEVSGKIVAGIPFPLPPLAEQHRIVAKVDELMALCDSLEAKREKREATRDRLTTASLSRLTGPDVDKEHFKAHAAFAINVLPELTTRPDQIKALRQTILDLALRGRLVEQDPNDEPAETLVRSLAEAKDRAIAEKRLKRSTSSPPVDPRELAFPLPDRWAPSRLGAVFDVRDGTHDTPRYVDDGIPLVTSKNLSSGTLSFDGVKLISVQDHENISARSNVEKGDVLFAMIGSIGNPVIVDTDCEFSIKNVALFKYYDPELASPKFLQYFLMHAAHEMKARAVGGLQPFVSLGFLRHFPISLPPLAEQNRITAMVDVLMMLCNQIEEARTMDSKIQSRLLEVLLMETVQPIGQLAA